MDDYGCSETCCVPGVLPSLCTIFCYSVTTLALIVWGKTNSIWDQPGGLLMPQIVNTNSDKLWKAESFWDWHYYLGRYILGKGSLKSSFLKSTSVHHTHLYLCISNTESKENIPMEFAIKYQAVSILSAHASCLASSPADLIWSHSKGLEWFTQLVGTDLALGVSSPRCPDRLSETL